MKWRLVSFNWNDSATQREVRSAKNRVVTLRLWSPSTLSFSMDGKHEQASWITELVTDIVVHMDASPIVRLRSGTSQDTVAESGHGVSFAFADYREVLRRRRLNLDDVLSYPATDQADIAWGLIDTVQSRSNGDYGIVQGVGSPTGNIRSLNFKGGQFVGSEIDSMAKISDGFDWDVSAEMEFNVYYPTRGASNGIVLDYGRAVSGFTRSRTPSKYVNDLMVTGGVGTSPALETSVDVLIDPAGRWDGVQSEPDVVTQSTLDSRAVLTVSDSSIITGTYNLTLSPGFWRGVAHIGLGDTVQCVINTGRLSENFLARVSEIKISIDDDAGESGGESVTLSVVPI